MKLFWLVVLVTFAAVGAAMLNALMTVGGMR